MQAIIAGPAGKRYPFQTQNKEKNMKESGKLSLWTVTALVLVVSMIVPWVVFADVPAPDGDDATPISASPLYLGTQICEGSTVTDHALIAIKRAGKYGIKNVFANGANVAVSVDSVSGTGLSASMDSPNTITLPDDWEDQSDGQFYTDPVGSGITLVAGSAGSFEGSVTYAASGPSSKEDEGTITRYENDDGLRNDHRVPAAGHQPAHC
jgi:hypothetical protein